MEKFKPAIEQTVRTPENFEMEKLMGDFYKKYFEKQTEAVKKISLDNLKELKEKGITTEQFLDYVCRTRGFLLHGSINEIQGDKLNSRGEKIFAANKSAIAIMRSIYSNADVDLEYPYFIGEDSPLELKIHTQPDGKFISSDRGFVYVVQASGFKNDPEGSWQFVKEGKKAEFHIVIETEKDDFKYPVRISSDFESE